MKNLVLIALCASALQYCSSRAVEPEETVVSVYTTQPTTAGTGKPLDVYHQIANNIAEKITSPIYRFLGYNKNKTEETTKRNWDKIELLEDSSEDTTRPDLGPIGNDIDVERDVEEVSLEANKRIDKKPEKIILYSSYLPPSGKLEATTVNNTNEIDTSDFDDDSFDLDDVDSCESRGYGTYLFELLTSLFQLLWGGITTFFKPSS